MEKSEIAARGWRDHVLIMGGPGAGRTVWAHRQATKVPIREWDTRCGDSEYLYRVAGLRDDWNKSKGIMATEVRMPFRAPHHSVSVAGLWGAIQKGWRLRPGELALAHGGVFFMDGVTEFSGEALRVTLETVRRGHIPMSTTLEGPVLKVPAEFRLIVACDPCPCGWRGHPREGRNCNCSEENIARYMGRLGPLLEVCRLVPANEWQAEIKEGVTS